MPMHSTIAMQWQPSIKAAAGPVDPAIAEWA